MPEYKGKHYAYTAKGRAQHKRDKEKEEKTLTPEERVRQSIKDTFDTMGVDRKRGAKKKKTKEVELPGSIKNEHWLRDFHNAVVKKRRVGITKTPEGTEKQTMKLGTTTFLKNPHTGEDGEWTYILPTHNPDTRKTVTMQNAEDRYWDLIRSGRVTGYRSVEEAEKDLHSIRKRIIAQTPKYSRGSKPAHKGGRLRWRGKSGIGHHSHKLSELIDATEIK